MHDDRRTMTLNAGARYRRVLMFIDYAALTSKDETGTRTDEVSFSLGGILFEEEPLLTEDADRFDLSVVVGLRLIGDNSGQDLQNDWHDLVGQEPTVLPYEEADDELLAWFSTEYTIFAPLDLGTWRLGGSATLQGLVTSEGAGKISPAIHGFLQHNKSDLWIGLRHESRAGDASTATKDVVRDYEDGTWATFGVRVLGVPYFSAGYNLDTEESYGVIGLTLDI
jgi:hypothetical protein